MITQASPLTPARPFSLLVPFCFSVSEVVIFAKRVIEFGKLRLETIETSDRRHETVYCPSSLNGFPFGWPCHGSSSLPLEPFATAVKLLFERGRPRGSWS